MKIICIYHSRDLDGWMSAAIVKKWAIETDLKLGKSEKFAGENIDFMGWDYGDDIPDLSSYGQIIIVDVAFSPEQMFKLHVDSLHKVGNLVWIDHHKSAIDALADYYRKSDDREHLYDYPDGLRDTGFAACELTWKYFMQGIHGDPDKESEQNRMPEIVRLLGMYDSFRHKNTDEEQKVLEFQYAARRRINNYDDAYKHLISELEEGLNNPLVQDMLGEGRGIYKYLCTEARQTYKKAFPIEFKSMNLGRGKTRLDTSIKFLCVNQERFNPVNFGIDYHKDGYDGFACFWYKNGKWIWSIYSDNDITNCSIIAEQYGGGGHFGASGFIIDNIEKFLKQHK